MAVTVIDTIAPQGPGYPVVNAPHVGYTPTTAADWDGAADPGDLDDALDQLAERVADLESAPGGGGDAADITYTPTTATDWDSDTDPGNVDDALDQLAERVDDNEAAIAAISQDASGITYTPTTATDWDSDTDPGNVDDALDQLAERVDDLEGAPGGGDASAITYTPTTATDWDGDTDPGNVDDALDQLAERVDDLEWATPSVAAKLRRRTACFEVDLPTSTDARRLAWIPDAITVGKVKAWTDTGTVTFQIERRSSPYTSGTNVLSSALVADSGGEETTAFAASGAVAGSQFLAFVASATASSPTTLTVVMEYTVDE